MALESHKKITRAVCVLLKLTIGLLATAVPVGAFNYYEYSELPTGTDISEVFLLSDSLILGVGLIQILLGITTGVVFLRWVYVSNRKLRAHCPEYITFTPGWSVGWFFIPIANLWKPFQIVREIWVASHGGDASNDQLVGIWWGLFIVSGILARVINRLAMSADDLASYNLSTLWQIAGDAFGIVLSLVAILMVQRIGAAFSENFGDHE